MRKNELIKLLSEIKGNPEINIWNGLVGDVMPIKEVSATEQFKYSLTGLLDQVRRERCRDKNNPEYQLSEEEVEDVKRCYKQYHHWDMNPYITEADVKSGRYIQKKSYTIDVKRTGKRYHDRIGAIDY
jgi:hypothetical protein